MKLFWQYGIVVMPHIWVSMKYYTVILFYEKVTQIVYQDLEERFNCVCVNIT